MTNSKHRKNQKQKSLNRTKRLTDGVKCEINKFLKNYSLKEIKNTNGKVLTILNPNDDCFKSIGDYIYIGTTLKTFNEKGFNSPCKLGKSEIRVQDTIKNTSDNRYTEKDPFVILDVICVDEKILNKFKVKTVRQLEEKIRKENGFIRNQDFNGDEWWTIGFTELSYKVNKFIFGKGNRTKTYGPRVPQKRVITKMVDSFTKGYKDFLFGAIMRFGKNFTFMYAITEIMGDSDKSRVLVWTNKPGVYNSLEEDVKTHVKFDGYEFINLKNNRVEGLPNKCVVAASKQLLDSDKNVDLLEYTTNQDWDFIVIDESHSGVETENSVKFLNKFKNTKKIFISGTPQKQVGKIQFNDENTFIYDESDQKIDKENGLWDDAIILQTRLIKLSADLVSEYKNFISDETGYFTFTKFFSKNVNNKLVYESTVLKFFRDIFGYTKFNDNFNFFGVYNHLIILLPDDTKAIKSLKKTLMDGGFSDDYEIISATGSDFKRKQLDEALESGKKTITLTCGKLIEGTTVPEWDCSINMSDGKSIFEYLQFAFRPTNPNDNNSNKEAHFYDLNPQRHFMILNDRLKQRGERGLQKEKLMKEYYKNFNILIGGSVSEFKEVDFNLLKSESYKLGKMISSLNGLLDYSGLDSLSEMVGDLCGVHNKKGNNIEVDLNDNDISGGKNIKNHKIPEKNNKLTDKKIDKELELVKEKFSTVLSRIPYVLYVEGCKTVGELLDMFSQLEDKYFESALGIPQNIFEKYWKNSNFIDKEEMEFYLKGCSQTFK